MLKLTDTYTKGDTRTVRKCLNSKQSLTCVSCRSHPDTRSSLRWGFKSWRRAPTGRLVSETPSDSGTAIRSWTDGASGPAALWERGHWAPRPGWCRHLELCGTRPGARALRAHLGEAPARGWNLRLGKSSLCARARACPSPVSPCLGPSLSVTEEAAFLHLFRRFIYSEGGSPVCLPPVTPLPKEPAAQALPARPASCPLPWPLCVRAP